MVVENPFHHFDKGVFVYINRHSTLDTYLDIIGIIFYTHSNHYPHQSRDATLCVYPTVTTIHIIIRNMAHIALHNNHNNENTISKITTKSYSRYLTSQIHFINYTSLNYKPLI